MEISMQMDGQIVVVSIVGRIDSATAEKLEHAAATIIAEGASKVIFDLRKVDYVSSAGLRAILMAAKRTNAAGGGITLFGLQPAVDEIMTTSGFASIITLCANEADARAWFSA